MNFIAFSLGGTTIYWSSIIIALGLVAGILTSLSLSADDDHHPSAMLCFFPLAVIFSLLIGRLLHWYFCMQQYPGFFSAMTDYSSGGVVVSAVLAGAFLAAVLVCRMGLSQDKWMVLDTAAPGIVLSLAFVRLAHHFGTACRSKVTVSAKIFQRLPFAVASTDAAGNVSYSFAVYFMLFLLFLVAAAVIYRAYVLYVDRPMKRGVEDCGHIARLALVLCSVIEMVLDSTRNDPTSLNFTLLSFLNRYVGFISVVMLVCALSVLFVFIFYMKRAECRDSLLKTLLIAGYSLSLAGMGGCEYLVQRFTGMFRLYRSLQVVCGVLMVTVVYKAYKLCCKRDRAY